MKLALGSVQFGLNYGIQGGTKPSEEEVHKILSLAIEQKIECFDTAAAYGDAEEIIGCYRKKNPTMAKKMHVISKLSPKALDEKPKELWKDIILKNINQSIQKLNVNELEAFLFHNAEYIFDENAVYAMYCASKESMVKKIGVSIYTPQEAMKALEYDEIKIIQIPYNVFDHRLDKCGFFEKATKKGVEIYARSSMLQGLILMKPDCLPSQMYFAKKYLNRFLSICEEHHFSPLKAAVCYVGRHPSIDYVVFGVDNKVQLLEYLSVQEEHLPDNMARDLWREFENVEEKLINPVLWNRS